MDVDKHFVLKHVDEHREKLSREVETLAEEHELLRRDLNQENEAQSLLLAV